MNNIPAYERVQFVNKDGMLTDGISQNLDQLYQTLRRFSQLISTNSSSQIMSLNVKYFDTFSGLTNFTLPSTCQFGDFVAVIGGTAGGWKINTNTGQQIRYGTLVTTSGGSLNATDIGSCAFLICTNQNTNFIVESFVGTLTVT